MDNEKLIQAEMARAQAGLQDKIAKLKHVVEGKLATPAHVIENIERSSEWVISHRKLMAIAAISAIGVLLALRFAMRRYRLAPR
jgi:hypothetical protein